MCMGVLPSVPRVIEGCELPGGCLDSNLGPQEEKPALLITEFWFFFFFKSFYLSLTHFGFFSFPASLL